MQQLADDVWHIPLTPRDGVNAYLLGDVLVDSGIALTGGKLLKAVKGRTVTGHALTHAHVDHAGASAKVVKALGLDGVMVGAADAEWVRTGKPTPPPHAPVKAIAGPLGRFAKAPVARELKEGDEVGPGFVVIESPGHSPGHVSFWRERDGILITGDVFFNLHPLTTAPGLRQPVENFTTDPAQNRRSERKVTELNPSIVGFGHGPVLKEPAKLRAFVQALPSD